MSRTPPDNSSLENLRPIRLETDYGIPRQTSANWRCAGIGPPFIRISNRMILYPRVDLERWLAERKVTPKRDGR
jgi:hypothetical protein